MSGYCPTIQYLYGRNTSLRYVYVTVQILSQVQKIVPQNFFGYYPHALYRAGSYTVCKRHCHQLQVPIEDRVDLQPFATSLSNVLIICESEDLEESVEAKKHRAISDAVETTEEQAEGNLAKRRRISTRGIPEEARYDGVK